MKQGIIKWFSEEKGYGFITSDDKEYFVHASSVKERVTLIQGQHVQFTLKPGSRGEQANDVEIVEADGNRW